MRADVGGGHETLQRWLDELETNNGPSPEKHIVLKADMPRGAQSKTFVLDPEHDAAINNGVQCCAGNLQQQIRALN